jgi:uncharacterized lipoprotein YbaY
LSDSYQIEGEILIEDTNTIDKATTYVRIEDTSRANAPSKIVSENILRNVKFLSNLDQYVVPFNISVPIVDENKMYTLSVHVDVNGNGKLDKGDYINMESYPVPLKRFKEKVMVKVKKIK